MDRVYRTILVLAAAVIGGLALYVLTPDMAPYVGEDGAAPWSWFLLFASGIAAHLFLPKSDLSRVSLVLVAVLASALAAVLTTWLLLVLIDFPIDGGYLGQLVLIGAVALVFAGFVFVPIYLFYENVGRSPKTICLLSGALLPAAWVFAMRPFGDEAMKWIALEAAAFSIIGASAAVAFTIVASRREPPKISEVE